MRSASGFALPASSQRVDDARPGGEMVDAGMLHLAGDVHHDARR